MKKNFLSTRYKSSEKTMLGFELEYFVDVDRSMIISKDQLLKKRFFIQHW